MLKNILLACALGVLNIGAFSPGVKEACWNVEPSVILEFYLSEVPDAIPNAVG